MQYISEPVQFFYYYYTELRYDFQFGDWAGQLGDGRAVILGEYINK